MCIENFEKVRNRATKSYKDEGRKHKTLFGSFFLYISFIVLDEVIKRKMGSFNTLQRSSAELLCRYDSF